MADKDCHHRQLSVQLTFWVLSAILSGSWLTDLGGTLALRSLTLLWLCLGERGGPGFVGQQVSVAVHEADDVLGSIS